jgi:hypothetical protein
MLFSPQAALDAGIAVTAVAVDKAVNANGLVSRAANGRFKALATSTKNVLKVSGSATLLLPVLDWALNTGLANVTNTRTTAELLDGVSTASAAARIAVLNLLDDYNNAVIDGDKTEDHRLSLEGVICRASPTELEQLFDSASTHLGQLQIWKDQQQTYWQQMTQSTSQLDAALDDLQVLVPLTTED